MAPGSHRPRRRPAGGRSPTDWPAPASVTAVAGDVADPDHRAELVARIQPARVAGPAGQQREHAWGRLRCVSSAGCPSPTSSGCWRSTCWDPSRSPPPCSRHCPPGGGMVIDISSDAAVEHYPGWGAYGASKAALDHLTLTFGVENPDIACYAIDPGDMRTEMQQAAFPGEDISDRRPPADVVPALLDLIQRRPPGGRYRAGAAGAEPAAVGAWSSDPRRPTGEGYADGAVDRVRRRGRPSSDRTGRVPGSDPGRSPAAGRVLRRHHPRQVHRPARASAVGRRVGGQRFGDAAGRNRRSATGSASGRRAPGDRSAATARGSPNCAPHPPPRRRCRTVRRARSCDCRDTPGCDCWHRIRTPPVQPHRFGKPAVAGAGRRGRRRRALPAPVRPSHRLRLPRSPIPADRLPDDVRRPTRQRGNAQRR